MKTLRQLTLLLLILLALLPQPALAEDGPWGDVLNPDGSVRWDVLVDLGTVSEPASWMTITLPGGMQFTLDATYHRYQTPSGHILVLPSPATLFFMALNPNASGLSNADSMLGNGAAILANLIGPNLTTEQLSLLLSQGYTDATAFFQAVIDGQANLWTIINHTFLFEVLEMSFDSGFLVNALLLYVNGVANCDEIPGGCAGMVNDCSGDNCFPVSNNCPLPSISQAAPVLTISKTAPEFPLVIGQDPERRGADFLATAVIPPVRFTWHEEVQEPPSCVRRASGTGGSGCPGTAEDYIGYWEPGFIDNPAYDAIPGDTWCVAHTEILPETIGSVQARASLSAESRHWILNDLASKYYGATIRQPEIALSPEIAPASAWCGADGVCQMQVSIPNVPFADPGVFDLRLWVATNGAAFTWNGISIPLTEPRILYAQGSAQVYVTLVSLVPVGAP